MSDLISRKQTIIALRAYAGRKHGAGHIELANGILNAICLIEEVAEVPTVEAKEMVHGEWERVGSGSLYDVYECTNCHCPPKWDCTGDNHWKIAFTNFCPNCGADMRKRRGE